MTYEIEVNKLSIQRFRKLLDERDIPYAALGETHHQGNYEAFEVDDIGADDRRELEVFGPLVLVAGEDSPL